MYYESFRERIHHYLSTMAIAKKFYDDGLLTKMNIIMKKRFDLRLNPYLLSIYLLVVFH